MDLLDTLQRPFEPAAQTVARAAAVPEAVARKLARLMDLADSTRALVVTLGEQSRDARGEERRIAARLEKARADARSGPRMVVSTAPTPAERASRARGL